MCVKRERERKIEKVSVNVSVRERERARARARAHVRMRVSLCVFACVHASVRAHACFCAWVCMLVRECVCVTNRGESAGSPRLSNVFEFCVRTHWSASSLSTFSSHMSSPLLARMALVGGPEEAGLVANRLEAGVRSSITVFAPVLLAKRIIRAPVPRKAPQRDATGPPEACSGEMSASGRAEPEHRRGLLTKHACVCGLRNPNTGDPAARAPTGACNVCRRMSTMPPRVVIAEACRMLPDAADPVPCVLEGRGGVQRGLAGGIGQSSPHTGCIRHLKQAKYVLASLSTMPH